MSVIEIEKIVQGLPPQYLKELEEFLQDLLRRKETVEKETAQNSSLDNGQSKQEKLTERQRIALRCKGDAPYPNMTVSEAEFYEQ